MIKRRWRSIYLLALFVFVFIWSYVQPYSVAPDEAMKFDVINYLVNNNALPDGRDASIRNPIWGISYAYQPYLSLMISALFMKITSFFTKNMQALVMAARLVNVFLITGIGFVAMKIGDELLEKGEKILFVFLVTLLPGSLYLGTYVNNDVIALFSIACIIYGWIRVYKYGWTKKRACFWGLSISLCALSYYNAYSYILCSMFFFIITALFLNGKKWDIKTLIKWGSLITFIVILFAGWWFVRNAILYDGDILARETMKKMGELYAQNEYKPSKIFTPQRAGMTIGEMLLYVHGTNVNSHNYLITVFMSFIGVFGSMEIFPPGLISKLYLLFFFIAILGVFKNYTNIFGRSKKVVKKEIIGAGPTYLNTYTMQPIWKTYSLLHLTMVLASLISALLAIWYSYANDYQAQGRYFMPALIPFMYFVVLGYRYLFGKLIKSEKLKFLIYIGISVIIACLAVYCFVGVFYPYYYK